MKVKNNREQKAHRGFSMLEVMLAVSVLSVSLVTLIRGFSMIAKSHHKARNYLHAMLLSEQKLFEIQEQSRETSRQEGIFEEPQDRFYWIYSLKDARNQSRALVDITIGWGKPYSKKGLKLFSSIRKDQEHEKE